MTFTMLAHIEGRKVEAKDLYLANKSRELPLGHILFSICQQTILHEHKITE